MPKNVFVTPDPDINKFALAIWLDSMSGTPELAIVGDGWLKALNLLGPTGFL